MDCTCPASSALTEIPALDCGVNLNQIQRIAFQRGGNSFNTAGVPPTDILELAAWQALQTAADNTKIIVTPLIGANPIIDAGEAITNGGGDNSTLNGVEEVVGVNPSLFSCEFKELTPEVEKALKKVICEKNLTAYLISQGGKIAVVEVSATEHKGFEVQSPFLSDRSNAGYGTLDTHAFRFSLKAGWSENLKVLTPNFNPLTEL